MSSFWAPSFLASDHRRGSHPDGDELSHDLEIEYFDLRVEVFGGIIAAVAEVGGLLKGSWM